MVAATEGQRLGIGAGTRSQMIKKDQGMRNVMIILLALFATSAVADESDVTQGETQIVSANEQIVREKPHADRICEASQTIVVVHCDGPDRKATLIACDPKGEPQVYRCTPSGYPLPPIEPPAPPLLLPPPPAPAPYVQRVSPVAPTPRYEPRVSEHWKGRGVRVAAHHRQPKSPIQTIMDFLSGGGRNGHGHR